MCFANVGTTACGGLGLDASPSLVAVGDWVREEEHFVEELLLALMTSP